MRIRQVVGITNFSYWERRIEPRLAGGFFSTWSAAALGVSLNTVSFHIRHIYDKLDVHSKAEAVATALKNHLV
jgi:DNA-binding CsgD family transcriptional regulator